MAARRAVRHRLFEHLPHHRRRGMLCATQAEPRSRLVRVPRGVSLGHGHRVRLPRGGHISGRVRAVKDTGHAVTERSSNRSQGWLRGR